MCDCSTYLALRRGRRSFREQLCIAVCFHAAHTRCTDAFFSPPSFSSSYVAPSRCQFLIRTKGTSARNQPRYESADISPTGYEVRARINQAAQLGRLYSQNPTVLLLKSVLVGTMEWIRITDTSRGQLRDTVNFSLYVRDIANVLQHESTRNQCNKQTIISNLKFLIIYTKH